MFTGCCDNCGAVVSVVDLVEYDWNGEAIRICPMCEKWVFDNAQDDRRDARSCVSS